MTLEERIKEILVNEPINAVSWTGFVCYMSDAFADRLAKKIVEAVDEANHFAIAMLKKQFNIGE